ncbi:unnamed protein product [Brassica rapa subsp. narinosa]
MFLLIMEQSSVVLLFIQISTFMFSIDKVAPLVSFEFW